MSRFVSAFAPKIEAMLAYRIARGFKEKTHLPNLLRFDKFCAEHYPQSSNLTYEVVYGWIDVESAKWTKPFYDKATTIRQFALYLNAIDEDAYVLPEKLNTNKSEFVAYNFTDDELSGLFTAIDRLPTDPNEPFLTEIAPVLFRLTYTCGLRPNESRQTQSVTKTAMSSCPIPHASIAVAVQSSNGTYNDEVDRENLNKEVTALKSEIDRISTSTHYNGINLLDGSAGGTKISATPADNDAMLANAGIGTGGSITLAAGSPLDGEKGTLIIREDGSAAIQVGNETYTAAAGATDFTDKDGNVVATLDAAFTTGTPSTIKDVELSTAGKAFNAMEGATVANRDSQLKFQIGANGTADQSVGLNVGNMSTSGIGDVKNGSYVNEISIGSQTAANDAIKVIDAAINQVSGTRADLGALQNRMEHTINNLGTTKENLTAAESSIRDVDMAKEMMEFTKNNILVQASQSMLSQANQLPQGVLQLLK